MSALHIPVSDQSGMQASLGTGVTLDKEALSSNWCGAGEDISVLRGEYERYLCVHAIWFPCICFEYSKFISAVISECNL